MLRLILVVPVVREVGQNFENGTCMCFYYASLFLFVIKESIIPHP